MHGFEQLARIAASMIPSPLARDDVRRETRADTAWTPMTDRDQSRASFHPPGSAPAPRIALIGHCGPDSWMLQGVAQRAFPGGEVVMVHDDAMARSEAARADLLLINRELDGEFPTGSGLYLIGELILMKGRRAAVMLISNLDEAQAQAKALGAARGFGKSKAGSPDSAAAMREAIAHAAGMLPRA